MNRDFDQNDQNELGILIKISTSPCALRKIQAREANPMEIQTLKPFIKSASKIWDGEKKTEKNKNKRGLARKIRQGFGMMKNIRPRRRQTN